MARLATLVLAALMLASTASAFRVINLDNGGVSGSEQTFVPGGRYRTMAACNRGSLIGKLELIFLQYPEVSVKAKGILHDLDDNQESRLTNFEIDNGSWNINGSTADLRELNNDAVFAFTFTVNGIQFSGSHDGDDLPMTQRATIRSATGCSQDIEITNRHPAVEQWGTDDNSDTVVGDNYFVGVFRGPAQHSLVNEFSITQNAKGLVDVRGQLLMPAADFESANIVSFTVDDDDVSIFVSFFPSLTRYDLRLSLNYKNNKDMEVRPETYELSFYTGNMGPSNTMGSFSRLGVQTEVLLVLDQTWELLEQSSVSIVDLPV